MFFIAKEKIIKNNVDYSKFKKEQLQKINSPLAKRALNKKGLAENIAAIEGSYELRLFDYSFDNPTRPSPYEYNQTILSKAFLSVKRYNSKRRLIDWWFDGIDWSRICWLLLRSIVGVLKL